jgi:mycoredoxin
MTSSDNHVIMYSTEWCGYCRRLKTAFKAEKIDYTEVDIEADPEAAEFVASVNGGNQTVPTVKFPDGTTLTNPSIREVKAKLGV